MAKRNLISSVFIAMLIGLAYQEMLAPVRDSVRTAGFTFGTLSLAFTFFFTSMRFFIGNQLHLLNDNTLRLRGDVWIYDFLIITLQTVILCFLGGVSSVEVNRIAHVGFLGLLIALYLLDIAWVVSQWTLGRLIKQWRRESLPWPWAVLNTLTVIVIAGVAHFAHDPYSSWPLVTVLCVSAAAFVADMILIDYYDVV